MKSLSKLLTVAFIASTLLITSQGKAQTITAKAFALSLGVETGLPTGNVSNYSNFTLGGTVRLQYGISNNFALTFTTGGSHFFMKTIPGTDKTYSSFGIGPVKGGFKYAFTPNVYFGAEAGVGVEVTEQGFSGGQKKLLISPALGYTVKHWDFAVQYESLTGDQNNYGFAGLRLAYCFGL